MFFQDWKYLFSDFILNNESYEGPKSVYKAQNAAQEDGTKDLF